MLKIFISHMPKAQSKCKSQFEEVLSSEQNLTRNGLTVYYPTQAQIQKIPSTGQGNGNVGYL
jgi:hypothetical protein